MINIVFELTLIDDMVNLLTNALNSSIKTNLTNDEFVVLTLAKLETLINRLIRVSDDIF